MLKNSMTGNYWLPTYKYRANSNAGPIPSNTKTLCNFCTLIVFTPALLTQLLAAWQAGSPQHAFSYVRKGSDIRQSFNEECEWCRRIADGINQNISEYRFREHYYRKRSEDPSSGEEEEGKEGADEDGVLSDEGDGFDADEFDESDYPEYVDPLESACEVKIELVFLRAEDAKFKDLEVRVEAVGEVGGDVLHLLQGDTAVELLYHTYSGAGNVLDAWPNFIH
jgi:hypothetical protein